MLTFKARMNSIKRVTDNNTRYSLSGKGCYVSLYWPNTDMQLPAIKQQRVEITVKVLDARSS